MMSAGRVITAGLELAGVPGTSYVSETLASYAKGRMFKTHQKRVEDVGQKPLDQMSIDERVAAEQRLKQQRGPLTREEKVRGAHSALKSAEERGKALQDALEPSIQRWLKDKKLNVGGYPDRVKFRKTDLVLTKPEQETLHNLMVEEMNRQLAPWVGQDMTEAQFKRQTTIAHDRARVRLLNRIKSGSTVEGY